jgi:hypothetical protein
MEIRSVEFTSVPGKRRLPRYMRTAFVKDGAVWVSPFLASSDALFCALIGGERILQANRRPYVRTEWLKRNYPELADHFAELERRCHESVEELDKP